MTRQFLHLPRDYSIAAACLVVRGESTIMAEARLLDCNYNTMLKHFHRKRCGRSLLDEARALVAQEPREERRRAEQKKRRPCLKCGDAMLTIKSLRICASCRRLNRELEVADVDAWGGLLV